MIVDIVPKQAIGVMRLRAKRAELPKEVVAVRLVTRIVDALT